MSAQTVTKELVETRNADWVRRLEALFALVETWRQRLPMGTQAFNGDVIQRKEEMLREFGVPEAKVPTYAICVRDQRMSFVPAALWVIAANGRVNITTNTTQYILIDFSKPLSMESDWRIVTLNKKMIHPPFDEQAFRDLCNATFGAFQAYG